MKKILLLILSWIAFTASAQQLSPEMRASFGKIEAAVHAIKYFYVDTVSTNKLAEDAIRGMLAELDPHSTYTDAEETKNELEPINASFDGIGIQFNMLTDTLYIVQIIPGGPSERAGLIAGDRILSVNDTLISGIKAKNSDVMKRLRGPRGSKVKLEILRGTEKLQRELVRDKIPINSRQAQYLTSNSIGYIRLSRFSKSTFEEYKEAVDLLKKAGMKSLILDLRYNGGGLLDQAVQIAGTLLPAESTVLSIRNTRKPAISESIKAPASKLLPKDIPVAILINEFSASASEILAGAIQDWDRGIVIGRRTFGKGLIQRPLPLQDGSMVRLTIARYYTPSGRSIQKPYSKGNQRQYEEEILERIKHGELIHSDSIKFPDSLKYRTLKYRRTVYGGGGIMPDIFVPADTAAFNKLHRSLLSQGILNRVVLKYVDEHRSALKKRYPDRKSFEKFNADTELLSLLEATAKDDKKIVWDQALFDESKEEILQQLHAYIARDILGEDEFFYFFNQMDKEYLQAIELLSDPKSYKSILKASK